MTNHLKNSNSPYLLQHVDNPVDWYPWNKKAFEKAKRENKPVFLSIGYSTCHWCHVMAHESFENEKVAQILNESFISIKVDREQRPDIDQVYMDVCQLMTGRGGWPLTIIMTPDKEPFFGATYIPLNSRYGMMGIIDTLNEIKKVWESDQNKISDVISNIKQVLEKGINDTSPIKISKQFLDHSYRAFRNAFDETEGGFGSAPKFPSPHNLLYLLRYYHRTNNNFALKMVERTLLKMRLGGIYDHLGYGFHRYSTDNDWLVPHFEKMLYDQAMLLMVYMEFYQITKDSLYLQTGREIIQYLTRDMMNPDGGFYNAEDADSEGEEGKFYVWNTQELKEILSNEDYKLFSNLYSLKDNGNYFDEATQRKTGTNIIHLKITLREYYEANANQIKLDFNGFLDKIQGIRKTLFEIREERIHPLKDTKIITNWNGLIVAALAISARYDQENREKYLKIIRKTISFIHQNFVSEETGYLLHEQNGEDTNSEPISFSEDYSFWIWSLLETFRTTQDFQYLEQAISFQNQLDERFWDSKGEGGYYFTPDGAEELLSRKKPLYDGAIPSTNSVSLTNLLILYHLTSEEKYINKAEKLTQIYGMKAQNNPTAFSYYAIGIDLYYGPTYLVSIIGNQDEELNKFLDALDKKYLPHVVVISGSNEHMHEKIKKINESLTQIIDFDSSTRAYICDEKSCKKPIKKPEELFDYFKGRSP